MCVCVLFDSMKGGWLATATAAGSSVQAKLLLLLLNSVAKQPCRRVCSRGEPYGVAVAVPQIRHLTHLGKAQQ